MFLKLIIGSIFLVSCLLFYIKKYANLLFLGVFLLTNRYYFASKTLNLSFWLVVPTFNGYKVIFCNSNLTSTISSANELSTPIPTALPDFI